MFEVVKLWLNERRLWRKTLRQLIAKAETQTVDPDTAKPYQELAETLESYRSFNVIRRAAMLHITFPVIPDQDNEHWKRGRIAGKWYLTDQAFRRLHSEIRGELTAKREMVIGWLAPLHGIIGTLLGAILGFFLGKS